MASTEMLEPIDRIDRNDRICYLDDDWERFAAGNCGGGLTGDSLLGTSLYGHIEGEVTTHLYKLLVERVRRTGDEVRVAIRCDQPDARRWLSIRRSPFEHEGVEFHALVDKVERREPVALLDPLVERGDQVLRVCSWCKKAEREGAWREIEEVIMEDQLFLRTELPMLTHGCCESCYETVMAKLDAGNSDIP